MRLGLVIRGLCSTVLTMLELILLYPLVTQPLFSGFQSVFPAEERERKGSSHQEGPFRWPELCHVAACSWGGGRTPPQQLPEPLLWEQARGGRAG